MSGIFPILRCFLGHCVFIILLPPLPYSIFVKVDGFLDLGLPEFRISHQQTGFQILRGFQIRSSLDLGLYAPDLGFHALLINMRAQHTTFNKAIKQKIILKYFIRDVSSLT